MLSPLLRATAPAQPSPYFHRGGRVTTLEDMTQTTGAGAVPPPAAEESQIPVRLDAWLWAVRIFKTRSLASAEVKAAHIRLNGASAKPSQKVRPGDTVTVRYPGWERVLVVRKTLAKRVGAPVAFTCYDDISGPKPAYLTSGTLPRRERGSGRPTKSERRALNKLRGYEKE